MSYFRDVPIAQVRDFWNRRPCNIRHSSRPIGEREYFDEVEARKYFVEPHIPGFAAFSQWSGKRVLEVGCGIGTDTINFARAGAQVTAIDLSERSLEIARNRAAVYKLTNINFVHANVEELAAILPATTRYDLVYSFGVLHHTPNPNTALRQMVSFLAPGGTLKLMVYHRYSWKAFVCRNELWPRSFLESGSNYRAAFGGPGRLSGDLRLYGATAPGVDRRRRVPYSRTLRGSYLSLANTGLRSVPI